MSIRFAAETINLSKIRPSERHHCEAEALEDVEHGDPHIDVTGCQFPSEPSFENLICWIYLLQSAMSLPIACFIGPLRLLADTIFFLYQISQKM